MAQFIARQNTLHLRVLALGSDQSDETIALDRQATTLDRVIWQQEANVLAQTSIPLVLSFALQYSLTVASVFIVGHIGKVELAAVSLASMTAKITGYSIYQGLATSLDTLCAQAYGAGRKHLVGLHLQRMIYFLMLITIPIGAVWLNSVEILRMIVPDDEIALLAGLYLKIIFWGTPGYAIFESGKRFVQAQGQFNATMYVLLVGSPFNIFLNWLLVWHLKWGFIGAPIAVAVTDNLLPVLLFLYVYFTKGYECWGGFSLSALCSWSPMIELAFPGLVMVLAEFLAFEALTLASSYLSTAHLAAQGLLSTMCAITFHLPFPISIAASTRLATLIGGSLISSARTAALVAIGAAFIAGFLNFVILFAFKSYIPRLLTSEPDVLRLTASVLPICVALQLFDSLATMCNGILRGLGRQNVGGYINFFAYYAIAMPISLGTCFGLGWELHGLWAGPAVALVLIAVIEGAYIFRISWEGVAKDARRRNAMG